MFLSIWLIFFYKKTLDFRSKNYITPKYDIGCKELERKPLHERRRCPGSSLRLIYNPFGIIQWSNLYF